MSRFTGPKGKVVRRLGVNVFGNPKFDRLLTKRPYGPGVHGNTNRRRRVSEYGKQLVEKQKLKFSYGMRERQFRALFEKASRQQGVTGNNLLVLLERRLDNVIYRAGFASTRDAARQIVSHGHVLVNGRKVTVPSFSVRPGDVIEPHTSKRSKALLVRNATENNLREVPLWLDSDKKKTVCKIMRLPVADEIQSVADVRMIVELYSK